MTTAHRSLALVFLALAFTGLACGSAEAPPPDAAAPPSDPPPPAAEAGAGGVTYEPAYPEEVSSEGLSEGDVAQQEASHSQGADEEHSHGGDEHTHDAADHPHDGPEADHSHDE